MRTSLSRPLRLMLRHGLLTPRDSFFDYGCGTGDDIRILRMLGIAGTGWDPRHGPRPPLPPTDIVNLGYVLNVIADPSGRRETLHAAWEMTTRLLAVTVPASPRPGPAVHDGPAARRRGASERPQREWQDFIDEVLAGASVTAGSGVYYLFRDHGERDDFLARRPQTHAGSMCGLEGRTADSRPLFTDRLRRTLGRRHMLRETANFGLVTFGLVAGTGSVAYSQTRETAQQSGPRAADVAARIRRVVAERLGVDEAKVTDSAYFVDDLDADSLDIVEIAMALEEEFDCEIPDEAVDRMLTVKDAFDFVMRTCGAGAS